MKNQKSSKENEPATNLRISLLAAKYIVPPGLHTDFFDFLNLCKIAKDNPIMIVGDTGVGKSMFLHVINKLFEQEHGGDTKKHPVCWVNCAHFEPNLARFELFGHVKGSFSGAIKTTDGSVKIADNGLLILEWANCRLKSRRCY